MNNTQWFILIPFLSISFLFNLGEHAATEPNRNLYS